MVSMTPDPLRRALLGAASAGALGAPFVPSAAHATARVRPPVTRTLTATVFGVLAGYRMLPFDVPEGATRVDVSMTKSDENGKLGIGLFDARGSGYQSEGFRGIFGEERSSFHVSAASATEGFVPGPMPAGRWHVVLAIFAAPVTAVSVTVRISFDPQGRPFRPGRSVGVVRDEPGWYRGDLHCHTTASSDAWGSGSAMTPREWADSCRAHGLDYVAMTDHNVISQNYFLARDAGEDVLLMPGEEMTNWSHGHATVSGIDVGDWLDFRQKPQPHHLPDDHARIADFIRAVEATGGYAAAAHPSGFHLAWQFAEEGIADPASRTHGWEVWTGPWGPDDEISLMTWDRMLSRGQRVIANGGSDLHGVDNDDGFVVGTPTTVVYADRLATPDIIAALKAGRAFITRRPDGVEVYPTVTHAGRSAGMGGSVYGDVGDRVGVSVRVRRAGGLRLTVKGKGGVILHHRWLTSDDETVDLTVRIPLGGGYVRAEVRGWPDGLEGDMEAITNPVHLVVGDAPEGEVSQALPVPEAAGPRRVV